MAITIVAHVFGGGPQYHQPFRESDMALELRSMSSVLWHFVTIMLVVFAAALAWLAYQRNTALAWFTIASQVGFAGVFLYYGLTDLQSPWPMPQWIVFLLIPALTLLGLRTRVS